MAILATRMLERGTLPGSTVVATVMSNLGLERALAAKGGKLLRTAVGDRYVVEAMRSGGHLLGGEQSGHIIFLDHATTGDGMVAALRVLAVMGEEGRPLSELARAMVLYPQVLLNFAVAHKRPFDQMPSVQSVIARVESDLGAEGRVVVRYSGTESKARVMIEGANLEDIRAQAEEIAAILKKELAAPS
jgi:phosphoglucosamine mutase